MGGAGGSPIGERSRNVVLSALTTTGTDSQSKEPLDVDKLVNIAIVVTVSLFALTKLATVDMGLMRGWTVGEIAFRIPVDNWRGYTQVLAESPVQTKAITSMTVYSVGDYIAQVTEGKDIGSLDRARVLRSGAAGLIGHGPLSHLWYESSEAFFNNVLHLTQWWSFIPKVVVDQALWGPFWNNCYILLLGLMSAKSLPKVFQEMKDTTIPLVVAGLKLWPLAHCVTYGLIPVENRLLWVDLVEIIWVTILATTAASGGAASKEAVEAAEKDLESGATKN